MQVLVPIVFLLVATYTDIKERKIRNYITYPMALLGVLLSENPLTSIGLGLLLGIVLPSIPGLTVGAGNIKLIIACGTWLNDLAEAIYFVLLMIGFLTVFNIVMHVKNRGFASLFEQLKTELFLFLAKIFDVGDVGQVSLTPFMLLSFMIVMWLY